MPASPDPHVKEMIALFLGVYDNGRWKSALVEWPDEERDGDIDAIATLGGARLAIEHTLIEPFEGNLEEVDRLRRWFLPIEADPTLRSPGLATYVLVSRDALRRGAQCDALAASLHQWLRSNLAKCPPMESRRATHARLQRAVHSRLRFDDSGSTRPRRSFWFVGWPMCTLRP